MAIKKVRGPYFTKPLSSFEETKVFFNVLKNQVIILDPALRFASAATYVLKID